MFSSILYNFYLGENATSWMNPDNRVLFVVFRVLMLVLILWGSMQDPPLSTIFSFADLTMALLALVNLLALALMLKVCFRLMHDYDQQSRTGAIPVFDPNKFPDLNIDRGSLARQSDQRPRKELATENTEGTELKRQSTIQFFSVYSVFSVAKMFSGGGAVAFEVDEDLGDGGRGHAGGCGWSGRCCAGGCDSVSRSARLTVP